MSIVIDDTPAWLQNGVYPARIDRQLIDAVWTEGVVNGLDLSARAEGANFSVDVAAGHGVIGGDDQAAQGAYLVTLSGKVNVPVAAPDSQGRIDLIVAKINDPQAGGGTGDNGTILAVKGTPATTPVAPTLPASAIELGRITVASSAVSITAAAIDNLTRPAARSRGGSVAASYSEKIATVTFAASGTLSTAAPPSLTGWFTTAADGTMTFLRSAVVGVDLTASRSGVTQFITRCYGPTATEIVEHASTVVGGTFARADINRVVPVTKGQTLRLVGMSTTAGAMVDIGLAVRVAILNAL
jgi:hypothetical protein